MSTNSPRLTERVSLKAVTYTYMVCLLQISIDKDLTNSHLYNITSLGLGAFPVPQTQAIQQLLHFLYISFFQNLLTLEK